MFKNYKKLTYKVDDYHTLKAIDITQRFKINERISRFGALGARKYIIKEGERPENISYKIYGTPNYAYAILILNGIHNLYDEWPKDSSTFKKYLIKKYGSIEVTRSTNAYYYINGGIITSEENYNNSSDTDKYAESIYVYEERINNEKRSINILSSTLIKKLDITIKEILNSTENL